MRNLQPMPIADRLSVGAPVMRYTGTEYVRAEGMDLFRMVGDHKKVKLADDQRVKRTKGQWNTGQIFGHLNLPYPMLWVEWHDYAGKDKGLPVLDMAISCIGQPYAAAYLAGMTNDKGAAESLHENSWLLTPYMIRPEGDVYEAPALLIVDIDEDGMYLGVRAVMVDPTGTIASDAEATSTAVDLVWDGLMAVGWMNCRNVELQEVQALTTVTQPAKGKKKARKVTRTIEYHTIVLPGHQGGGGSSGKGDPRDLRLHHVRGHFKTFTSDAPLMGKHVGTFWWGWQVRGSKANGLVVSDYLVSAS